MALTTNQKQRIRAAFHDAYSAERLPIAWTKADVDAAITSADNWVDANTAGYVTALSEPFKTSSSAADKSVLFIAIAIAQRLVSNPEHVNILSHMLSDMKDIQGA